jgi:hypothetical protein
MQTGPLPRSSDAARPRKDTLPPTDLRSTPEPVQTIEPEPHWEIVIDSATD